MSKRLSNSANGYVTNSEIAYFNIDDSYFIATDDNVTTLYDGDDGHASKSIPGGTMRPWWVRWARVHWPAHNTNNVETWPGVKK